MELIKCVLVMSIVAFTVSATVTNVNESFSGTTVPDNWVVQGEKDGASAAPGTAKTVAELLPGGQLTLTTAGSYQRASAFFTNDIWGFSSLDFTIEAEINVGAGADGLALGWIDARDVLGEPAKLLGGYGGYHGIPRGAPEYEKIGYVEGLTSYSFAFDTYSNEYINSKTAVGDYEATFCMDNSPGTWKMVPNSLKDFYNHPAFFQNVGWVSVKLVCANDTMTFTWPGGSYSWETPYENEFPCFMGVGAGTGGQNAEQSVRNVAISGTMVDIPEPAILGGIFALVLFLLRKK